MNRNRFGDSSQKLSKLINLLEQINNEELENNNDVHDDDGSHD